EVVVESCTEERAESSLLNDEAAGLGDFSAAEWFCCSTVFDERVSNTLPVCTTLAIGIELKPAPFSTGTTVEEFGFAADVGVIVGMFASKNKHFTD
ncbi:MAG: hypothetical protein ACRC7P_08905, partial [Enterovibrio sp.]